MGIPKHVFKSYDIRGLSPGEIDADAARLLGRAVVAYGGAKTVLVGRDMRATTPELAAALIAGIMEQGADVVDMGLTTTPMFYFATATAEADAGVMVTASHNPAQYNGFKLCRGDAGPIGAGSGMEEIRDAVLAGNFSDAARQGSVREIALRDAYIDKVLSLVPDAAQADMTVAVDTGNGMAGHVVPALFAKLPDVRLEAMYLELDGTFPNHEANPIKEETLADLKAAVKKHGAALGIAYDGDADRVGFVDDQGETIPGDLVAALVAPELLRQNPGGTVLSDVRCSRVVPEEVERAGGVHVMSRVGHAHIKRQMKELGAVFAGELSSHFYFRDFYGVECADGVALILIDLIRRSGKPLSELVRPLRRYAQSGEINFEIEDKAGAIARIRAAYAPGAAQIIELDGIRIEHDDWWCSVRASNTEPVLRLNVEGKSREKMEQMRDAIAALIRGEQ
ncbi:phosphomannomutase/phosphoglucomutase [Patescibacteria group bacterium]|nr:MAG: phosphomannomutase/phosphoglucomutase [Patescibacteria group bacterium]